MVADAEIKVTLFREGAPPVTESPPPAAAQQGERERGRVHRLLFCVGVVFLICYMKERAAKHFNV
jgi:hypothetical protein